VPTDTGDLTEQVNVPEIGCPGEVHAPRDGCGVKSEWEIVRNTAQTRVERLQGICKALDVIASSIVADAEIIRRVGRPLSRRCRTADDNEANLGIAENV